MLLEELRQAIWDEEHGHKALCVEALVFEALRSSRVPPQMNP